MKHIALDTSEDSPAINSGITSNQSTHRKTVHVQSCERKTRKTEGAFAKHPLFRPIDIGIGKSLFDWACLEGQPLHPIASIWIE